MNDNKLPVPKIPPGDPLFPPPTPEQRRREHIELLKAFALSTVIALFVIAAMVVLRQMR